MLAYLTPRLFVWYQITYGIICRPIAKGCRGLLPPHLHVCECTKVHPTNWAPILRIFIMTCTKTPKKCNILKQVALLMTTCTKISSAFVCPPNESLATHLSRRYLIASVENCIKSPCGGNTMHQAREKPQCSASYNEIPAATYAFVSFWFLTSTETNFIWQ